MKITNKLPQFEGLPVLFITSGEYEAFFYVAHKGEVLQKEVLSMPPREESKEKQAFIGHKGGMPNLSSISHSGQYDAELKIKFAARISEITHDIVVEQKLNEIYLFAPKYVISRILNKLRLEDKKKIRMQFYKEYTKESPLRLIELFNLEAAAIEKAVIQNPKTGPIPSIGA